MPGQFYLITSAVCSLFAHVIYTYAPRAGPPGLEPGTAVLETDVLPLKL